MVLCVICLDTVKSPMALPCGEFFFLSGRFALIGVRARADLEYQDMSTVTNASSRKLKTT